MPRMASHYQWLGETRKAPPLVFRMSGPANHDSNLDFRFLASTTMRKYTSVVLSHPACGALLRQPQGMNTERDGRHGDARPSVSLSTQPHTTGLSSEGPRSPSTRKSGCTSRTSAPFLGAREWA